RPKKGEFELNGASVEATWFERTLAGNDDPTKPQIAGRLAMEIDGEDCGMNVYVQQQGDKLIAVFRNREREQWERESAQLGETIKRFENILQQGPPPQVEAQLRDIMTAAKRTITRNEVQLEDSVNLPDNLKFEASCTDATGHELKVDTARTR